MLRNQALEVNLRQETGTINTTVVLHNALYDDSNIKVLGLLPTWVPTQHVNLCIIIRHTSTAHRIYSTSSIFSMIFSRPRTMITHLSEVPRVELVEKDAVVVLATSVTASTRMFPVLPDTPVTSGHMPPLLAVLRVTRRLSIPIRDRIQRLERTRTTQGHACTRGGKRAFW